MFKLSTQLFLFLYASSFSAFSQPDFKNDIISKANETVTENNSNINFIENKGQWPIDVNYMMSLYGQTAWFMHSGVRFDIWEFEEFKGEERMQHDHNGIKELYSENKRKQKGHIFQLQLINASGKYSVEESNKSTTYYNYFLGNDSTKWASNVELYREVSYNEAWKGIDVHFYSSPSGELEYDFLVAPHADPQDIQFKFNGGYSTKVDENGRLVIQTQLGPVVFSAPKSFQEVNGQKQYVESEYTQDLNGTISFSFPKGYNREIALVIDPILTWSTFFNGASSNADAGSIALDANNNPVIAGVTPAINFPITLGAYNQVFSGGTGDCYVSKLSADATNLIFSTFLGGGEYENLSSLKFNSVGEIVVGGSTLSINFPMTVGAYNTNFSFSPFSNNEGYVTKLTSDGAALLFSTYINETNSVYALEITATDEILIGGTAPVGFATTPGAYSQTFNGGGYDAFLLKLNSNGTNALFSTYLGGNDYDYIEEISISNTGDIIIVGETRSFDFPTTSGAFDQTFNGTIGSSTDGFVAKFNSNGSVLLFSTLIGGSATEYLYCLELNSCGDIIVAGLTFSDDFPVSANAYGSASGGGVDACAFVLSNNGSVLLASTYLGTPGFDMTNGLIVDGNGEIIWGIVTDPGLVTTAGALQPSNAGARDFYLSKFSSDLTTLVYGTYLGGTGNEWGQATAATPMVAHDSCIVVSMITQSANFPTTPGVFQPAQLNVGSYATAIVEICGISSGALAQATITVYDTICVGGQFLSPQGNSYGAGSYNETYTNVLGCDSLVAFVITEVTTITTTVNENICFGTQYISNQGNNYSAGSYDEFYMTTSGCDSIVTFIITELLTIPDTVINETICVGTQYTSPLGNTYGVGTHVEIYNSVDGCDSTVTFSITELLSPTITMNVTVCFGQQYTTPAGNSYGVGSYDEIYPALQGCDTIVTFIITEVNNITDTIYETICFGEQYISPQGNSYSSGLFDESYSAAGGCDSIVTFVISEMPQIVNTVFSHTVCYGDQFISAQGNSYSSGVYEEVYTSLGSGCDSIVEYVITELSDLSVTNTEWVCFGSDFISLEGAVFTPGTYIEPLTAINGCDSSITLIVSEYDEVVVDFYFDGTDLTSLNSEVHFINTSQGVDSFIWEFGDSSPTSSEVSPLHEFPNFQAGVYYVTLTGNNLLGCSGEIVKPILIQEELIFYIPNTFTPDGDEFNQVFKPVFTSGFDVYDYTIIIFNRWGQQIFVSSDIEIGWDGSYNGKSSQDGMYTWKVEFKELSSDTRQSCVGHVNLIR
jgi:gliding motility-associated-like protein